MTTASDTAIEPDFRSAMATVATPVCVVTTLHDGQPHGTTVSAFAALSLAPPMVLVVLDRESRLLRRLDRGGRFGVNVLADRQSTLATVFAGAGEDRFAGVAWREVDGAPRLEGPSGWLGCEIADLVPGGDHIVVLGVVLAAEPLDVAPLTYHRRTFGTHRPIARPVSG